MAWQRRQVDREIIRNRRWDRNNGNHRNETSGPPTASFIQAGPEDKKRTELFFVSGEDRLENLSKWLKARNYNRVKKGMYDKRGNGMIGLNYESHEGVERCGLIVCQTVDLRLRAEEMADDFRMGGNS